MKLDFILPKCEKVRGFYVYINNELRKDIKQVETLEPQYFGVSKLFEGCGAEWVEDEENLLHFRATDVPEKMVEIKDGVITIKRTIDEIEELNTDLLF